MKKESHLHESWLNAYEQLEQTATGVSHWQAVQLALLHLTVFIPTFIDAFDDLGIRL